MSSDHHVHIDSGTGLDPNKRQKAKELLDLSKNLYLIIKFLYIFKFLNRYRASRYYSSNGR